MDLQTVAETVDVTATPDKVWELIGQFGAAYWHPLIAEIRLTGTGRVSCGRLKRSTASRSSSVSSDR